MIVVEVIWIDAWSSPDDAPMEGLEGLYPIIRRNVGYLLQEREDAIILAAGIAEKLAEGKDSFSDRILIPREMIKEIRGLK